MTEDTTVPLVEIVIPIKNEKSRIDSSINKLLSFAQAEKSNYYEYLFIFADNGSSNDDVSYTRSLVESCSAQFENFTHRVINEPGRGQTLKRLWLESQADVVGYLDVDMSTDLSFLKNSLAEIEAGADLVFGDRYHPNSNVRRTIERRIVSASYRWLAAILLPPLRGYDIQCGCKIGRRESLSRAAETCTSKGYFFDTELLLNATLQGASLKNIAIKWTQRGGSKVRICLDSIAFIFCILKLRLTISQKR